MALIRADAVAGSIAAALSSSATTMESEGLADLPAISGGDFARLTLYRRNLAGRVTAKEIVHVTAHSAGAETATILRAQGGTSARTWVVGDRWDHAVTAADLDDLVTQAAADAAYGRVFAVDVDTYGAGQLDAHAHVMSRIEAADNRGGGIVDIPWGLIKISQTLVVPHGVSLQGGFGRDVGMKARWPEIWWEGAAGGTMVETDVLGGENLRGFQPFNQLVLRGLGHLPRPGRGLLVHDRCDSFAQIQDFQVIGTDGECIVFEKGGLNVWLTNVRWDEHAGVGFLFNVIKGDSLTLENFTSTNLYTDRTTYHDSAMEFDFTTPTASPSAFLTLRLASGKFEQALNRPPGRGTIQFTIAPASYVKHWAMVELDTVWSAPNADVTEVRDICVSPASDLISIKESNCQLTQVTGIPSYRKSPQGTGSRQPLKIIAPHTKSQQALPNTDELVSQITGALDIEELFSYGVRAAPIIYGTTATLPSGTTIYPGMWLFDPAQTGTRRVLQECSGVGTVGTLSGVTATAASGAQEITVNDATNIRIGQRLRFTGISGIYRVVRVQYPENIVTLSAGLMAAASNTEVTYAAPAILFRDIGGGERHIGTGSPNGVVTAPKGADYTQTDGVALSAAGTGIRWTKTTASGNTGWEAYA